MRFYLLVVGAVLLSLSQPTNLTALPGLCFAESELAVDDDHGLQAGDEVAAWHPVHVAGPEAGTTNCPVCTHLRNPMVMGFGKWNAKNKALITRMNQFAEAEDSSGLKVFFVVVDGSKIEIESFALENELEAIRLCVISSKTREQDLAKYRVGNLNSNVVLAYLNFKVLVNANDLETAGFAKFGSNALKLFGRTTASKSETANKPSNVGKAAGKNGDATVSKSQIKVGFVGNDGTNSQEGHFSVCSANFSFSEANLSTSRLDITIDMNSTQTEYELLTKHLKGDEYFDTEKYPRSSFVSKSIRPSKQKGRFTISGVLKFHGRSKEITFPAKIESTERGLKLTAKFSIKQTEFGMSLGEPPRGDAVEISIDLEHSTIKSPKK